VDNKKNTLSITIRTPIPHASYQSFIASPFNTSPQRAVLKKKPEHTLRWFGFSSEKRGGIIFFRLLFSWPKRLFCRSTNRFWRPF
jgi:hypothetical protein